MLSFWNQRLCLLQSSDPTMGLVVGSKPVFVEWTTKDFQGICSNCLMTMGCWNLSRLSFLAPDHCSFMSPPEHKFVDVVNSKRARHGDRSFSCEHSSHVLGGDAGGILGSFLGMFPQTCESLPESQTCFLRPPSQHTPAPSQPHTLNNHLAQSQTSHKISMFAFFSQMPCWSLVD